MGAINPSLLLTQDTYVDANKASAQDLSKAFQNPPSWLTQQVTQLSYALGGQFMPMNFPMIAATKGGVNGSKGVKLDNFEYKYPVMGRIKRETQITQNIYTSATTLYQGQPFKIYVKDKIFSRTQTILIGNSSTNYYTLRAERDPIQVATGWEYEVQILGNSKTLSMTGDFLTVGKTMVGGAKIQALQGSDGVTSTTQLPGVATNMLTYVREGFAMQGNMGDKVMRFKIKVEGAYIDSYLSWNAFLANATFTNAEEELMWTSTYGKTVTGDFANYDTATGEPIPMGSGIMEQITNISTYTTLTYSKLTKTITDVTFNCGANKANIVIWTGTGGTMVFNDALLAELAGLGFVQNTDKFVAGSNSWDMQFGSYFNSFKHINGHTITVMKHPMFDRGLQARAFNTHPTSGLPLSSYDMYFVDMSVYEGQPNVQYVCEKGKEFKQVAFNSMLSNISGYANSDVIHTAKDESSVQMWNTSGVQIGVTVGCFKLLCTAS